MRVHPPLPYAPAANAPSLTAIAFSYFELLLRLGSLPLLEQEIARLQSMTPWFVDQYASTYDDFGEAAIDLMEIMKDQLKLEFEGRMTWLGERFTGEGEDGGMGVMAVVQYFRVSDSFF